MANKSAAATPPTGSSSAATEAPKSKKKKTIEVRSLLPKAKDGIGETVVLRQGEKIIYSTTDFTEVEDTAQVQELIRLEKLEEK